MRRRAIAMTIENVVLRIERGDGCRLTHFLACPSVQTWRQLSGHRHVDNPRFKTTGQDRGFIDIEQFGVVHPRLFGSFRLAASTRHGLLWPNDPILLREKCARVLADKLLGVSELFHLQFR